MDFCAIDWNEFIKLSTPFLIAVIVYFVWHKQKGKEVIAGEAKSLLKNLLEESAHISSLKFEHITSKEILNEKIERINLISQDNYRSILYLNSCLDEKELSECFKNYNSMAFEVKSIIRKCIANSDGDPEEFGNLFYKYYGATERYRELVDKVILEISPFTIYQKNFKIKKYN